MLTAPCFQPLWFLNISIIIQVGISLLIVEGNSVRIINSALYAMEVFQSQMAGEAVKAGLKSEEDVINLLKEIRAERESE